MGLTALLLALGFLGWTGAGVVLLRRSAFAGLLLKRILEESIAAEELNTVLAMEIAVAADADLGDAIAARELLANRLLEWTEMRILRARAWGSPRSSTAVGHGLLTPPAPPPRDGERCGARCSTPDVR
jgi:hypothetical protein